jgi:fatty-acyl-CoA synthase
MTESDYVESLELNLLRRFNVADALHRSALRYPHRAALTFEDTQVSYQDLDGWANQVSRYLLNHGVKSGDVIAALALNHPRLVALWMGAARMGAVYCPINPMLPAKDIAATLQRVRAKMFFVDNAMLTGVAQIESPGLIRTTLESPQPRWKSWDETVGQEPTDYVESHVPSEAVSTLLFTSGTESAPKGVMNTHANWYAALLSMLSDLEMNRHQKVMLALPLFHVAGLYVLFGTLSSGAQGFLMRRIIPKDLLRDIDRCQLTWACLPATVFIGLLAQPELPSASLKSLKRCVVFQYIPTTPLNAWKAKLPHVEWSTYWGQSELTPLGASMPPEEFWNRTDEPDPIGLPHLPVELKLVDAEDNEVPRGLPGEIVVRSPAVMAGYFEDAARTAEAFRHGWHHTGDVAYQDDDGFIHFVDRKKGIIKCGGENVSSQKVEEAIASVHGVAEVAVIGIPDPYWIEAVVAVVVLSPNSEVTVEVITDVCKNRLARFEVPKAIHFVEALPKNPSGKILKRDLVVQFAKEAQ